MQFVAAHFNELDSSSTFTSPSCHSARRACPELQNPLFQKAKENLLTGEKAPARADEGYEKEFFYGPHPPSSTVPPLPEGEGYFWMMDSATSPSAPRRMTGWEAYCEE